MGNRGGDGLGVVASRGCWGDGRLGDNLFLRVLFIIRLGNTAKTIILVVETFIFVFILLTQFSIKKSVVIDFLDVGFLDRTF
jgi:hypothetical protein